MKRGGFLKRTPLKAKKGFKTTRSPLKQTKSFRSFSKRRDQTIKAYISGVETDIWSTTKADQEFSRWIIERDKVCLKCGGKEKLTCSHFIRRGHSATRYDPKNCITLCLLCHSIWEDDKDGEYKIFMERLYSPEEIKALEEKGRTTTKRTEAIINCMSLIFYGI
jgi:hypothetical protein